MGTIHTAEMHNRLGRSLVLPVLVLLNARADAKSAALCDNSGGALDCDSPKFKRSSGNMATDCPDHLMGYTQKYFRQNGVNGFPTCQPFDDNTSISSATLTTNQFPGHTGPNRWVISKAFVQHPPKAFRTVGVFGFKRVVCTGNGCKVHKQAACVDCNECTGTSGPNRRRNKPFDGLSRGTGLTPAEDAKAFIKNCVSQAFSSDGKQKPNCKCVRAGKNGYDSENPREYDLNGKPVPNKYVTNMELAELTLKAL